MDTHTFSHDLVPLVRDDLALYALQLSEGSNLFSYQMRRLGKAAQGNTWCRVMSVSKGDGWPRNLAGNAVLTSMIAEADPKVL